ncbi:MAG: ATP-binding protein [Candidatus Acidiferrales bacterium]
MRLTNLCVENFKRIVAIEITPAPGVTEISGANGAGKSSTLDAIAVWIDGLKVAPAEPIRKGAEHNSYAELQKLAIEFSVDIYLETVRAIGKDAIVLSDGELASEAATAHEESEAAA